MLFEIAHHRLLEFLGARAGRAGNKQHRPLPAQSPHDLLGAPLRFLGLQQIDLVDAAASAPSSPRSAANFFSSATIVRASLTGSASGSGGAISMRCSNTRVRCRCFKKRIPRPAPSAAPSIKPGMSAMTKLRPRPAATTPKFGMQRRERIIGHLRARRGHGADQGGFAGIRQAQASPTSAISFSSSSSSRFSPGSPRPDLRGVRLVLDLKRVLPHPPLPPLATSKV